MALPYRTTGSLWPTFVPVRGVPLTVKQVYAITLNAWFPSTLNLPLRASVTLWASMFSSFIRELIEHFADNKWFYYLDKSLIRSP